MDSRTRGIPRSSGTSICWRTSPTSNRSTCALNWKSARISYVNSFQRCLSWSSEFVCKQNPPETKVAVNQFFINFNTLSLFSDDHSSKVKSFFLDILCPLITEVDNVSNELLDIILYNVVEPQKSTRKNAYFIAKEVIIKTADALKTYIQAVRMWTMTLLLHSLINSSVFSLLVLQPNPPLRQSGKELLHYS